MVATLKADGVTGTVAIWTGEGVGQFAWGSPDLMLWGPDNFAWGTTDDLPFTDPLSHISRLRFHSDLEYPRVISTHTGTHVLPAIGAATNFSKRSTVLFAHGQAGTPFVEGFIDYNSTRVPLLGSVPIERLSGQHTGFAARWLHLGADATNVILNEATVGMYQGGHASYSVDWTVYLTDTIIT